ncbi:MAG: HAMP domain-containing histidine kinase [Burkholderiales bacterium]|nr:HAMP domain-containing histidine kinase [Burkholderiales bacterium]
MPQSSIQHRLLRTVMSVNVVGSLLTAMLVGYLVSRSVSSLMDSTLQESAEILYGLVQPLASSDTDATMVMPTVPHEEQLVWQVVHGASNRLVVRSSKAPEQPLLAQALDGFADSPQDWRVRSMPLGANGKYLYVAQASNERQQHEWEAMIAIVGMTWLIAAASAAWLSRRARAELEPLERLSNAVRAYDPLAGQPLPAVTRRELVPVQKSIEELGGRLARLVERERAFSAHAAHALRTPLAGLEAQLALALREATPQTAPRLRQTRLAAQRLGRVVSSLLSMFRSTGKLELSPVDLGGLFSALSVGQVSVTVAQDTAFMADANLLAAALSNLVDNSVRHGASHLTVAAMATAQGVCVSVQDDGAGIAPDTLHKLRAGLADAEHQGLEGLGLWLASLVARAHGGALQVHALPQGTRVDITLSAAHHEPPPKS